jgi:RimJ/RimL family protein N-acetyltransferase
VEASLTRVSGLWAIDWFDGAEALRAFEPTDDELADAAPGLARAYADPHNSRMMGQAPDTAFDAADVVAHFTRVRAGGGHPFLLQRSGALAGDADVRHLTGRGAEMAMLIADPAAQGKGLGTRFGRMLQLFAFRALNLDCLYVSIIPENRASRRLFEKLGFVPDDSPDARRHADEATDITLSLARDRFEGAVGTDLAAIRLLPRSKG